MYFEIVKTVLDQAIDDYSRQFAKTTAEIDASIRDHISKTSSEYENPEPNIDYFDPLCRLGYLYMHAGANATLFERTLAESPDLRAAIRARSGSTLTVTTVGGGPGTELLGLYKHLQYRDELPRSLNFTVLDLVPQWGETWIHLASEAEKALQGTLSDGQVMPVLSRNFHPVDVVDATSFASYAWLFKPVDVVVFNYLLSENKVWLADFGLALAGLIAKVPDNCMFVFIDRLERRTNFRAQVRNLVVASGLDVLDEPTFDGCMDEGETPLGDYVTRFSRRPRRWFRTYGEHYPTAFAIVARKRGAT